MAFSSGDNASVVEFGSADDAIEVEFESGSDAAIPCYSGFFGTCSTCDRDGSCICADNSDGHSDFIPMDRTRWGEPRLLCTINNSAVDALSVTAIVIALLLLARIMHCIRLQTSIARQRKVSYCEHKPLAVLAFCAFGVLLSIALHVLKLVKPSQLQAVNILPTGIEFLRKCSFIVMSTIHSLHVVLVAVGAQQTHRGQHMILRIIRRKKRSLLMQVILAVVTGCISASTAFLGYGGLHSIELQTTLFVIGLTCETLFALVAAILGIRDGRFHKRWFDESIQAAQRSLEVYAGGASRASHGRSSKNVIMLQQEFEVAEQISKLRESRDTVLASRRPLLLAAAALICAHVASLAVPLLWTRMSYIPPVRSSVWFAMSYPICQLYSKNADGGDCATLCMLSAHFRAVQRAFFGTFNQPAVYSTRSSATEMQTPDGVNTRVCQQV